MRVEHIHVYFYSVVIGNFNCNKILRLEQHEQK